MIPATRTVRTNEPRVTVAVAVACVPVAGEGVVVAGLQPHAAADTISAAAPAAKAEMPRDVMSRAAGARVGAAVLSHNSGAAAIPRRFSMCTISGSFPRNSRYSCT